MQKFNMNISTSDDFRWDISTKVTADQLPLVMDIMKLVMEHSKKRDDERKQKAGTDNSDIKKERDTRPPRLQPHQHSQRQLGKD